ncbi:NAD(P)/FAD-dependent oxidoreductase [Aquabacterium sp. OR-4]|uniref:NAD(P)/FAD-dependent oxidoreductase n=1 Tax=Aquabacterium sp. OR-4 TaxID=2978127 RepID=UPI0028C594BD|nr:FAD-dependent oxidoreductase [Aquabacterium sp. OR-4]MDT7836066.1 NAD(P)-binding protein [Aquabacterium sp. OR-4]
MSMPAPQHIAVIGAGLAGASLAAALARAGHAVQVFDKARGPGGRLATRRAMWADARGVIHTTALDHGAPGIGARTGRFQAFVAQALQAGWLAEWQPRLAPDSLPLDCAGRLMVPVPGMPALCRHLLGELPTHWSAPVSALQRDAGGWQVVVPDQPSTRRFDRVLLTLPPAQAAPLLAPHRPGWARHAAVTNMQPCWTLMGVADTAAHHPLHAADWSLALPRRGPLACVMRSDLRPGRARVPGQAHWVAHARAGWSRRRLEQTPDQVLAQLQAALGAVLGQPVAWLHSTVHRWRYALPPRAAGQPSESCWWDATQGLGVCGDFLGGTGAEGAWLSAQALADAVVDAAPTPCLP